MLHFLLLSSAFAQNWQADPANISFTGTDTVLSANSMDSGWMPSNSSLQIRLQVNMEHEATVSGLGTGRLSWDSNTAGEVGLSASGNSNTGFFGLEGLMEAIVSVKFDLPILGAYEFDMANLAIPLTGSKNFTPFSWNNTIEVDMIGDGTEVLNYTQSLPVIGSGVLSGEIRPNCVSALTENYMSFTGDRLDASNAVLYYDSYVGSTSFSKSAMYHGTINTDCAIQLVPSLTLSALGYSYSLDITQVDLPPVSQSTVMSIPAGTTTFYLPSADVSVNSIDFGTLDAGDSENFELLLQNNGAATLTGSISLQDSSGAFEIFGSSLNVAKNTSTSIVVSFEGLDDNQIYDADLVINSNDPAQPSIVIPISAATSAPEVNDPNEPSAEVDDLTTDPEKKGCSAVGGGALWLSGLALLGIRRRR